MTSIDFTREPNADELKLVCDWLERSNYRVLRPLAIRHGFSDNQPPEKLITVAILDTETTGTNPEQDRIIELGMVIVEVCPLTGQAYRVIREFNELEYPGMPIPRGIDSHSPHHRCHGGWKADQRCRDRVTAVIRVAGRCSQRQL